MPVKSFRVAQLVALLLVGLFVRLALIGSAGYRDDMTIFYDWFRSISALPPSQVYAHVPGLNYPPGFVVLYELSAVVLKLLVHGPLSDGALRVALKLPPIIFDIAGATLAYAIVRRNASHALALAAAAFIALNPAIIYDSAYWGQNDSVPTVLALFAVAALASKNALVAWPLLTFAILVKPPVLVLVPLLILHPFAVGGPQRRRLLLQTGLGMLSAFVMTVVLAVTYFPHPTVLIALRHLVSQLVGGSSYFPFNSLNAFNVWAIFAPFFVTDKTHFLALSMHVWGDLLFCAAAALIFWRYVKRQDAPATFEASTLLLLAFFLFLTEMHERYLYYAVVFAGAVLFKKPYGAAALILSLTLLLNLEYGLTFMYLDDARATMVNRYEFAPWLVHLCSIANVGVFFWLLAAYLEPAPASAWIASVRGRMVTNYAAWTEASAEK